MISTANFQNLVLLQTTKQLLVTSLRYISSHACAYAQERVNIATPEVSICAYYVFTRASTSELPGRGFQKA